MSAARILVIDDHAPQVMLLDRLLERDGYEVQAVNSLAAAERVIAEGRPALIVLDLNLPDGSGLEFARRLKSQPPTASITIVACTAAVSPSDEQRALEAGCDAFVAKPIDLRQFSTLVASVLS